MKIPPEPDRHSLVNEVLVDSELTEFRAATLELAVGLARQRRQARVRNRLVVAAMVPLLLAIAVAQWPRRNATPAPRAKFEVVHTVPLRSGVYVETHRSSPTTAFSDSARYTVVTTDSAHPDYRTLTDDALLAMFPNRPVGLIFDPEGHRHLVFLDGSGPSSPGE
jgi:hypothetical protein